MTVVGPFRLKHYSISQHSQNKARVRIHARLGTLPAHTSNYSFLQVLIKSGGVLVLQQEHVQPMLRPLMDDFYRNSF